MIKKSSQNTDLRSLGRSAYLFALTQVKKSRCLSKIQMVHRTVGLSRTKHHKLNRFWSWLHSKSRLQIAIYSVAFHESDFIFWSVDLTYSVLYRRMVEAEQVPSQGLISNIRSTVYENFFGDHNPVSTINGKLKWLLRHIGILFPIS